MKRPSHGDLAATWWRHNAEWREPAQIATQWEEARAVDPNLLRFQVRGAWWEGLAGSGITLLVTREYEHLVMALAFANGRPRLSFMRLPHPSGLVVDRARRAVHVASTRNPNQIFDFRPVAGLLARWDVHVEPLTDRPLVPVRSRFYPGCAYLHDLALVGGVLHANAVGENAVVRVGEDGTMKRVWWPRCIESPDGPIFGQNHIQLNSIAAARDLSSSFFSASADRISSRRPGHRNFATDKRGVIFDGKTREPVARGLTRPHSARLHHGRLWVANSGYGELGIVEKEGFVPVVRLPGWTRGLCLRGGVAFVGVSRVIPRFRGYAPGLDVDGSLCGVYAVEIRTARVLGSLVWPQGNQVFGVDWMPERMASGFPFTVEPQGRSARVKKLFYAFRTASS